MLVGLGPDTSTTSLAALPWWIDAGDVAVHAEFRASVDGVVAPRSGWVDALLGHQGEEDQDRNV